MIDDNYTTTRLHLYISHLPTRAREIASLALIPRCIKELKIEKREEDLHVISGAIRLSGWWRALGCNAAAPVGVLGTEPDKLLGDTAM